MFRILVCLSAILLMAAMATAQDAKTDKGKNTKKMSETSTAQDAANENDENAKEMSGMSIVGNDEAPKSLYIVPWKSSEIGVETSLNTLLDEGDVPVDRDVFKRQLEFYQLSTSQQQR